MRKENLFEIGKEFDFLGINSAGLSDTDKGLYDLGIYFGRYLFKD